MRRASGAASREPRSRAPQRPAPGPAFLEPGRRLGAGLIALAAFIVYLPALNGSFILDDYWLLADNPLIKAADGLYKFWFSTEAVDYWPVFNSALWIQWRLWGPWSTGYHVVNVALHVATALLMWSILARLRIPGAFLAAALFTVHPVNVESVAWITQLKNLLALSFFLLSILFYLQAEEPQRRGMSFRYGVSVGSFALAMLSKGSMAMLAPILGVILWWRHGLSRRDLVRLLPFVAVAAILVPVNVWFQARMEPVGGTPAPLVERLLGAGAVVWFYLYKALLPIHLTFVYPQWKIDAARVVWWLPLLAVLALTTLLWWRRLTWGRPLLLAWGYFCLALAPVSGLTHVAFMEHSLVADHYQHAALIGIVALAAASYSQLGERAAGSLRSALAVGAMGVTLILAILSWRQSSLYVDSLTLYQATLASNPSTWMIHNNLGSVLSDAGRPQAAIEHYEAALRLHPDFPDAHNNLGKALSDLGRWQDAIVHYERALELRPNYVEAHNNLGNILRDNGQLPQAIEHYRRALELRPDFAPAHNNLGMALAKAGRLDEAIEQFEQALRIDPDSAKAHNNLGIALFQSGQIDAAIAHFEQARRLRPDLVDAQRNLETARGVRDRRSASTP